MKYTMEDLEIALKNSLYAREQVAQKQRDVNVARGQYDSLCKGLAEEQEKQDRAERHLRIVAKEVLSD